MFAPADAATKLVELGQSESLRVLHEHDRRVGDVDPHLDHRGGDQHFGNSRPEPVHDRLLLPRPHPAVQELEAEVGEDLLLQPSRFPLGSPDLQAVGLVDGRADHKGLTPGGHLFPHPLVGLESLGRLPHHGGGHRAPPGRHLVQHRDV